MDCSSSAHRKLNTILFLTRSLDRGGAERQLVVLAKGLVHRGHNVCIVVFYGGGAYASELDLAGVRVIDLRKRSRWDVFMFFYRLVLLLWRERPLVLHSYLAVPNIIAVMLKPLLPMTRIVWGLRASNMDLSRYDWLSRLSYWLECRLSRYSDLIIANSRAGCEYAVQQGFPKLRIQVVANGIDTERFRLDPAGREEVRRQWGVKETETVVGLVARLDPMKGYAAFLRAAALIAQSRPNIRFVCIGDGPAAYRVELQSQAELLGLYDRLIWAGPRDDMPAVYSAFDIATSASAFGEGFSNSIAEAMSCERPCVVTDVGDSAWIVGNTGVVVTPDDYRVYADGLLRLIDLSSAQRVALGKAARERIEAEFGVEMLVSRTEQLLGLTKCE